MNLSTRIPARPGAADLSKGPEGLMAEGVVVCSRGAPFEGARGWRDLVLERHQLERCG